MAIVPKLIKAALKLHKALPEQVLSQGQALLKGLTGNSNFTNLPVDLNVFKVDLDSYGVSIVDARDGGKKAITLRNKQGGVVIRTIKNLVTHSSGLPDMLPENEDLRKQHAPLKDFVAGTCLVERCLQIVSWTHDNRSASVRHHSRVERHTR